MGQEELCLTWDEHNKTLIGVFEKLLENEVLVDCTIAAEGQYIKAHRVVLSACSPYFEMLFTNESEKNPIVVLKDIRFQDLKALIAFVYSGKVQIPEDRLGDFTDAAESLQIKGIGGGQKRSFAETDNQEPHVIRNGGRTSSYVRKRARNSLHVSNKQPSNLEVCSDLASASKSSNMEMLHPLRSASPCSTNESFSYSCDLSSATISRISRLPTSSMISSVPTATTTIQPVSQIFVPEILLQQKSEMCEEKTSLLGDRVEEGHEIALGGEIDTEERTHTSFVIAQGVKQELDSCFLPEQLSGSSSAGGAETAQAAEGDARRRAPLQCHECGQAFRVAAHLRTHLYKHSGERPFACADCGRAFFTRGDLGVHRRIHTGEKPFACPHCAARFRKSSGFHRHVRALHSAPALAPAAPDPSLHAHALLLP